MRQEHLQAYGSPLWGDGKGVPGCLAPFPKGQPQRMLGRGDFKVETYDSGAPANRINLPGNTFVSKPFTWDNSITPERHSLSGSTARGRGFRRQ